LFVVFFHEGKGKKNLQSWTIVLDLSNYISTCHSKKIRINFIHPNLTLSSLGPTITPWPFWNFHFDHPWQHHFTLFPTKQGQGEDHEASWKKNLCCWDLYTRCKNRLQVLGPTIRMNDHIFWYNQCCGWQLNFCIIQLPIARRPKVFLKSAPLSKQRFWQMQ